MLYIVTLWGVEHRKMAWDVYQFLTDYFLNPTTQGPNSSPGWVNIKCPMCDDHSDHGGFNLISGKYNCWKCGPHDVARVVQQLLGCRIDEAKEIIWSYSTRRSVLVASQKRPTSRVSKVDVPGGPMAQIHKKYLVARNFNPDKIYEQYHVLGTGPSPDSYRYRLVIPIIHKGIVVSFQTRDVTGQAELRYKSCPIELSLIHYKRLIYGLENYPGDTVGVVEGVFDRWRLGSGFGCGFGTSLTHAQLKVLSAYRRIIFVFDPCEQPSWDKAGKYVRMLRGLGCEAERVRWNEKRDPAELTEQEVVWLRRELGIK